MLSWMEVVTQWKQGIWLPRWAALAHWGYGEARFLFYPPASWNLGALLGEVLPWKVVPGVFIWCALTASGCTMFLLVRRWFARNHAIFAATLYAANPYLIVIVYWRSAFAELLAACLFPLLVLLMMRAEQDRARTIVPFGLLIAAAWLTNVPAAVMLTYSLALLAVTGAIMTRNWRVLLYAAAGLGLGAALAAFYLIPVIHEKSWVQIGEVLAPGYRPQDNFLFSRTGDLEHNRFNLLVSSVGTAELIVLAIAGWTSRAWRRQHRWDWSLLTTWAIAITLIMLPLTGILWAVLPQLQFVQFPWRWLLCLNVPFAFFVTLAFPSWVKRAAVCAAMLTVLWVVWHKVQPPWWDQAADIEELHDFISDGGGHEGTDEYVPAGVDPQAINKNAPLVAVAGKGKANVRMLEWSPQFKRFTAEVNRPERLRLKLFNYPAWQVEVNGAPIVAKSQPKTGEILIPLETGISEVRVRLIRTPDRRAGGIVSILTVLLLAGGAVYRYRGPILARSSRLMARSSR
jgi:6-pyruvoyl-tetrahydropterin synthase-like protein